jgi:hypothetical protein
MGFFCAAILFMGLGILLGLSVLLKRRYGSDYTQAAMVFSLLGAGIPTALVWSYYNEQLHNPLIEWERVRSLDEPAVEIFYREGVGFFADTSAEVVQLTQELPACDLNGPLATQYFPNGTQIMVVEVAHIDLPTPPSQIKKQLTFDVNYPVALEQGASTSFALYENGEIWCVERFEQGGLSAGAAHGIVVLGLLFYVVLIFIGGFVVCLIVALLVLELLRRRKRDNSENIARV